MVLSRFMGKSVFSHFLSWLPNAKEMLRCGDTQQCPTLADSNLLAPGCRFTAGGSIIPIIALCNMSGPQISRQPAPDFEKEAGGCLTATTEISGEMGCKILLLCSDFINFTLE